MHRLGWFLLFCTLAVLALVLPAFAVGPVRSPATCRLEWDAPTTNTDGSALTDLATYRVYVNTAPGAPRGTPTATVTAASATPAPGTLVPWPCSLLTDGQKYAYVTALDLAGNESANSNEVPFVFDAKAPVAPALRVP